MPKKTAPETEQHHGWKCPSCGAGVESHGKGGAEACDERTDCIGLICECSQDETTELHGQAFSDVCPDARCYHCDWIGRLPQLPKKLMAWERSAIDAGWIPPKNWKGQD